MNSFESDYVKLVNKPPITKSWMPITLNNATGKGQWPTEWGFSL